jgi:hypothetical protein
MLRLVNVTKCRFFHTPKETLPVNPVQSKRWEVKTYVLYNPMTCLTKIGRSTNYELRKQQLEAKHKCKLKVIAVINGDHEHILHKAMHSKRSSYEWFYLKQQDFTLIKQYAKHGIFPTMGEGTLHP